jgi:hypothetical protein
MNESLNARHTRKVIMWVFWVHFPMSLLMFGWLRQPFLSTIFTAATITCGDNFILQFIPIVSLVGILGINSGLPVASGFLTPTDNYQRSYLNLVEPLKT